MVRCAVCDGLFEAIGGDGGHNIMWCASVVPQKQRDRIADLEAAVLAAKVLLEPTTDATEQAWQVLDDAYHRQAK